MRSPLLIALAAAFGLALGSAPALASYGPHWRHHRAFYDWHESAGYHQWRRERERHCWPEWHHHHRVVVCR